MIYIIRYSVQCSLLSILHCWFKTQVKRNSSDVLLESLNERLIHTCISMDLMSSTGTFPVSQQGQGQLVVFKLCNGNITITIRLSFKHIGWVSKLFRIQWKQSILQSQVVCINLPVWWTLSDSTCNMKFINVLVVLNSTGCVASQVWWPRRTSFHVECLTSSHFLCTLCYPSSHTCLLTVVKISAAAFTPLENLFWYTCLLFVPMYRIVGELSFPLQLSQQIAICRVTWRTRIFCR